MKVVIKRFVGIVYLYSCLFCIPLPFILLSDNGIVSFCDGNIIAWTMIVGSFLVYIFHFVSFLFFGNKYHFDFVVGFCFEKDIRRTHYKYF